MFAKLPPAAHPCPILGKHPSTHEPTAAHALPPPGIASAPCEIRCSTSCFSPRLGGSPNGAATVPPVPSASPPPRQRPPPPPTPRSPLRGPTAQTHDARAARSADVNALGAFLVPPAR